MGQRFPLLTTQQILNTFNGVELLDSGVVSPLFWDQTVVHSEELFKQLHLLSDLHSVEVSSPVDVLRSEARLKFDVCLSLGDESDVMGI